MPTVTSPLLAAGGVLVRRDSAGAVEVAVVHRPKRDDWSLPKGKAVPGEPLMLTARREVQEETGSLAPLGMPLPGQRYFVAGKNSRVVKDVHYWAMWDGAGEFRPGAEVDDMRWLGLSAAREQLSYERDVTVLDALAAVPGPTSTVVLTRACGMQRRGGRLRLDDSGRQRARLLSTALPALGHPTLLAVSDRAAATLAPTGRAVGADCAVTPGYGTYPPQDVLSALVDEAESGPVVLAAPDRVVRGLLGAAMRLGDLADPQGLTARQLRSRRGGLWILSWCEDALVGLQYFPSLAAPALPALTLTVPVAGETAVDLATARPRQRGSVRRSR
jgi:8-oxo-dGTP diphosphatase